jgi:hypothetical protein
MTYTKEDYARDLAAEVFDVETADYIAEHRRRAARRAREPDFTSAGSVIAREMVGFGINFGESEYRDDQPALERVAV